MRPFIWHPADRFSWKQATPVLVNLLASHSTYLLITPSATAHHLQPVPTFFSPANPPLPLTTPQHDLYREIHFSISHRLIYCHSLLGHLERCHLTQTLSLFQPRKFLYVPQSISFSHCLSNMQGMVYSRWRRRRFVALILTCH